MLNEQTLEKLYSMRLNGMADAFKDQIMQPEMNELSFEERFAFLVDQHWTWKEDRRMQTLLRTAKLKDNACIEDIDYKTPRRHLQSWNKQNSLEQLVITHRMLKPYP